jgi:hypothetical protein
LLSSTIYGSVNSYIISFTSRICGLRKPITATKLLPALRTVCVFVLHLFTDQGNVLAMAAACLQFTRASMTAMPSRPALSTTYTRVCLESSSPRFLSGHIATNVKT